MRITCLYLKNYKHVSLQSINEILYYPNKKIQIILGTNGSGKSSVLRMLSPFPSNMKLDFNTDGVHKVIFEDSGMTYEITYKYNNGTTYSFKLDDIELNVSNTKTYQLQLIKEHLHITQYEYDVLAGNITFTNMSTLERKNWFMNIATADYTFSLKLYNKLREMQRDRQGSLKLLRGRLSKEKISLLTEKEKGIMIERISGLHEYIDYLLGLKIKPLKVNYNTSHNAFTEIENRCGKSTDEINRHINKLEVYQTILTISEIEDNLVKTTNLLQNLQYKINSISLDLSSYSRDLSNIDNSGYSSLEEIVDKTYSITKERSFLLSKINIDLTDINPLILHNEIKENLNIILDLLATLTHFPHNEEITDTYSTSRLDKLTELLNNNTIKRNEFKYHIKITENTVDMLNENKVKEDIQCPECNHIWKLGYDERLYKTSIEKLYTLRNSMEDIIKTIDELEENIASINEYREIVNSLFAHINNTIYLKAVVNKLDINKHILSSPGYILSQLSTLHYNVSVLLTIDKIDNELIDLNEKKNTNILEQNIKIEMIKSNISKLEITLNHELDKKDKLIKDRVDLLQRRDIMVSIEKANINLIHVLRSYKEFLMYSDIRNFNDGITKYINDVRMYLVTLDKELSKANDHKKLIDDISNQIHMLENEDTMLRSMISALSPTDGLIAKGIINFIKIFMDDINGVINNIWSYNMEILPCDISEDNIDLDYKFPVSVNGRMVSPDILKTSSSMSEIINLAFRLVSMKYKRLNTFPLFLDEFGNTMDSVHRLSAYTVLNSLADSTHSQLFLVSHYEECYNRFKDADVSVLSSNNIVLDDNAIYNNVMTIS